MKFLDKLLGREDEPEDEKPETKDDEESPEEAELPGDEHDPATYPLL